MKENYNASDIELVNFFLVFWRQKIIIVTGTFVITALVFIYIFFSPIIYIATISLKGSSPQTITEIAKVIEYNVLAVPLQKYQLENDIDVKNSFPKISVELIPDASIVAVSLQTENKKEGLQILTYLGRLLESKYTDVRIYHEASLSTFPTERSMMIRQKTSLAFILGFFFMSLASYFIDFYISRKELFKKLADSK